MKKESGKRFYGHRNMVTEHVLERSGPVRADLDRVAEKF